MMHATRRAAAGQLASLAALAAAALLPRPLRAADRLATLVIAGMPALPSVVPARLVASGAIAALVERPQFKVWRSPDQMRAGVVSGDMVVFGAPTYACANLRNRGIPVRQLNVLTWGLLYLMSRDPAVRRIEDIAGRTVALAFRHDAPDLIARLVLRRLGLEPDRDVRLQYVGSATEAVQLFLAGRVDLAFLSEPAATAAEMRGSQAGLEVHRIADLTDVYGRLSGRPARIPQAGLAVRDDFAQAHPELTAAIHAGCIASAAWVRDNPEEAGRLGGGFLDLAPTIVQRALRHVRLEVVAAAEARPEIERYFTDLLEMSPEILGGKLPDDTFYWAPKS